MEIDSFARFGYSGETIKVEADLRRGIPAIDIVGLPDGAVREARERMRAAIRNSGFDFPRERILINLSPADLRKEGSSFDLPIALAVLAAAEGLTGGEPPDAPQGTVMVLGELELGGAVRPVRGILPAVTGGLREGITDFIVPAANRAEAMIRPGARVIGVSSLAEAVHCLRWLANQSAAAPPNQVSSARTPDTQVTDTRVTDAKDSDTRINDMHGPDTQAGKHSAYEPDRYSSPMQPGYEDVRAQGRLLRALQIAAAGGHHLLAYGPPGCGKTLALSRFPSILPDLDPETAIELTQINGIAGVAGPIPASDGLTVTPPFRVPHPTASLEGVIGGGVHCRPGEISLAHGGSLFLDEAALFRAAVLQGLRAPLETGTVTVSRAGRTGTYPARFQLLIAMNPCPCGNYGSPGRFCTCSPETVEQYWKRLTAPLLDRIDLRVAVQPPNADQFSQATGFSMEKCREAIGAARRRQWERGAGDGGAWLNARLGVDRLDATCRLTQEARETFVRLMANERLSGRGGHGVLRVARTVADLAGADDIGVDHLREAAELRAWDALVPDFLT